jgi:alkaline phosphatase D
MATRLSISHGPICGEVTPTSAVLWARGNKAGVLVFEVFDSPSMSGSPIRMMVTTVEDSDLTGRVHVDGLKPYRQYHYRVALSLDDKTSDFASGHFRTLPPPEARVPLHFLFGSCLGGQGYARDQRAGYQIFDAMLQAAPDFFLYLGDTIYADTEAPSPPNVKGAEQIVSDLAGFRGRYQYNLGDPSYAAFLRNVPVYVTWDDHEIVDNFSGPALLETNPQLFADGQRAFFEYWPISGPRDDPFRIYRSVSCGALADIFILDTRSYRAAHVTQSSATGLPFTRSMLGEDQARWLYGGLGASSALWKFIVTSVPLSYPTGWPPPDDGWYDGWAGRTETPSYEPEMLNMVASIRDRGITNVVFLAGDAHYPYALSYDVDRDDVPDFYEFGSSPLSALALKPADAPDHTLNPTVLYAEGDHDSRFFNFGDITIATDGRLSFTVRDLAGGRRFQMELEAQQESVAEAPESSSDNSA